MPVDKNELGLDLWVAVEHIVVAVVVDNVVFAACIEDIVGEVVVVAAAGVVSLIAVPNFAALVAEENQTRGDLLRPVVAPDNLYWQQHFAAASFH